MASWIIHLRIAEALLDKFTDLDPARFAVGSIAPDSGIPDEKWEKFAPPPEVTHFINPSNPLRDIKDMEFFRQYLSPLRGGEDVGLISFRAGYFFHLITDNLWSRKIGRPTMQRYKVEFAADKDFIWEVKKDWYGLDFIYVRDHLDCLFWRIFLTAQPENGGLDFLLPEGVHQQVEYIRQHYQRTDEEIQALYNRPYTYLSRAQADCFVEESTRQISRIYNHIWVNGASIDGADSALDLSI
jgi:hypothetical protein